ncbi:hypothetical protein PVAP13_4KG376300 [Panicum virgatum]|uniref:Uncharacterized protein n=1 Tax=Panicum virgatum TaxID=38727 RepID=A0A8T0TPM6_PANVG|nr:hypothetical protein PVAP13_4KG376300 [Panicum virgatum]
MADLFLAAAAVSAGALGFHSPPKHVRGFEPTGSFIKIRKKSQVTKHGSVSRSVVVGAIDAG